MATASAPSKVVRRKLDLDRIKIDGGTQSRAQINEDYLAAYAERMREGEEFEDAVVYFDGSTYWLSEGFHRVGAAYIAGLTQINAEIRPGGLREALFNSLGSNARHGAPRTERDLKHALSIAHADPEWGNLPQREIAALCDCSQFAVWKFQQGLREIENRAQSVQASGEAYARKIGKSVEKLTAALESRGGQGPTQPATPATGTNGQQQTPQSAATAQPQLPAAQAQPAAEPAKPPPPKPEPCPDWVERAAILCVLGRMSQRKAAAEVGKPESTMRVYLDKYTAHLETVLAAERERRAAAEALKVRDQVGQVVPPPLYDVFNLRPQLEEACKRCNENTALAKRLLDRDDFTVSVLRFDRQAWPDSRNLYQRFSRALPFAVCPLCRGARCEPPPEGKARCHGTGWMNEDEFKAWAKSLRPGEGPFSPCEACGEAGKGCKKCLGLGKVFLPE